MSTAKKIEELRAKIDELEAQLKAEQDPMFDDIYVGDDYLFICSRFNVSLSNHIGHELDEEKLKIANAFKDKKQAQACADYLKDRFWFIRKAVEFADEYEFKRRNRNYYVFYNTGENKWGYDLNDDFNGGSIYMTEQNATKFCEWLNKHKPEGF